MVEIYSCYWRSGGKSGAGYLFSITPMTPTLWQHPTQMREQTQTQAKTRQIRSQWESCFKPLWWNMRQILGANMFKNRRKPWSWTEIQFNFRTKCVKWWVERLCLSRVDKPASLIFSCSSDLLHHHAYTRPNIARARKSLSSGQKRVLEFCYRLWKCPFWKWEKESESDDPLPL